MNTKWGYWVYKNVVAENICDALLSNVDFSTATEGAIYDGENKQFVIDERVRITETAWQPWNMPIGAILFALTLDANSTSGWNFILDKPQDTQICRYKGVLGNKAGHYDWHQDIGEPDENNMQRKLSSVLILSNPTDYEGGEFLIKVGDTEDILKLSKGSVIVFPSYTKHKVAKVTGGVRYSAVSWVVGPSFK